MSDVLYASSDWIWSVISLGFLLLILALYKLCIKQSVASNGRVHTEFSLPEPISDWLRKRPDFQLQHLSKRRGTALTSQQIERFGLLYDAQEIVFGVALYVVGLILIMHGGAEVIGNTGFSQSVSPLFLVFAGFVSAAWGIYTVVTRKQRNPFKL